MVDYSLCFMLSREQFHHIDPVVTAERTADGERRPNAGDVSGCDGSLCLRGGRRYLQMGKQLLGTMLELEKYGKQVCKIFDLLRFREPCCTSTQIFNLINLPFKPSCFAEF